MSQLKVALPAQSAAGADATTVLGAVDTTDDVGNIVARCVLIPPSGFTTVTGINTNNVTFSFRQVRAGSVVSTFASVQLNAGTNLAAETVLVVPLTASAQLSQDDIIDVLMHQNGTGLAIGAGVLAEVEIV